MIDDTLIRINLNFALLDNFKYKKKELKKSDGIVGEGKWHQNADMMQTKNGDSPSSTPTSKRLKQKGEYSKGR